MKGENVTEDRVKRRVRKIIKLTYHVLKQKNRLTFQKKGARYNDLYLFLEGDTVSMTPPPPTSPKEKPYRVMVNVGVERVKREF